MRLMGPKRDLALPAYTRPPSFALRRVETWALPVPPRDVLSIRGLETECVVGVYPRERGRPQPLSLDIDLTVDSEVAATTGKLSRTVDYDATAQALVFLLQSCRFGLLETAAHALARYLLSEPLPTQRQARVHAVRIQLLKPQALPGTAVAALRIERDASWATVVREPTAFGSVDLILDCREATIVRVNLGPGAEVALHEAEEAHDAELALTQGLVLDGAPFPRGSRRTLGRGTPRVLANPTRRWQSILCADSPALPRPRLAREAAARTGDKVPSM
ncbi:MAG: dihydroneopterin aldolase [Sorangiineae bacterium PRO1]|nr:dihydroneopterin aldolase [Sorangiineae bacterium PRO1]